MSLRIRALDFSPVTERFEGENLTGAPLRKPIEILRPRLSIAPSGTSASRRFSISVENSGRAQFITLSISLMRKGSAASGFTRSISTSILTHILRSSKIKKKNKFKVLHDLTSLTNILKSLQNSPRCWKPKKLWSTDKWSHKKPSGC